MITNETEQDVTIPSTCVIAELGAFHCILSQHNVISANESTENKTQLSFDFSDSPISQEWKERITKQLADIPEVFAFHDLDFGCTSKVKHSIKLHDPTPFKHRARPIHPQDLEAVRKHLQELLVAGVIRESQSPYSSPIVVVRKRNNDVRLCIDFRKLNLQTQKDSYALPNLEETFSALSGSKWFTVLDLKSGYYQIEVEEADKEKTAFVTPLGFWEFNRMPQGITNAPSTFQRLMERCVGDMNLHEVLVFLDDLIIFSDSLEEHERRLMRVLHRLKEYGLKLSPKKCKFFQTTVRYLGHIISESGVETDPEKIQALETWPRPKNLKELRSFLGFSGYYRRFIKGYSSIVRPLNDLTRGYPPLRKKSKSKDTDQTYFDPKLPFESRWTTDCQKAFDSIIGKLTSAPILGFADPKLPYVLHTDASTTGLGAALYQEQEGRLRAIAFASRGLSRSEARYPAHKLEFLALKWSVTEKFHDYLYGGQFTVVTDSNPLTYILTSAKLDATSYRWLAALSNYNFKLQYRAGKQNLDADGLSRRPHGELVNDVQSRKEQERVSRFVERHLANNDNTELVGSDVVQAICQNHLVKIRDDSQDIGVTLVESLTITADAIPDFYLSEELLGLPTIPVLSQSELRDKQRADSTIRQVLEQIEHGQTPPPTARKELPDLPLLLRELNRLEIHNEVLYRKRQDGDKVTHQLVLPEELRAPVLKSLHNDMGHLGTERTLDLARTRFYWPRMATDVEQKVKKCDRCIRRKSSPEKAASLVNITTTRPLELVCMDFLSLEPDSSNTSNILVMTDHFTKFAFALPTPNQKSKTVARCLWDQFIVHYGIPERLHSDQGPDFEAKLIKELCEISGIKKIRTTPYHPRSNPTERFNRTLLSMLGTLESKQKSHWKDYVMPLVHAYNCTRSHVTGFTPYELMFGRKPRLAVDLAFGLPLNQDQKVTHSQYVESLKKRIEESYKLASHNAQKVADKNKARFDRKITVSELEPGDRVLVRNVRLRGRNKLADKWEEDIHVVVKRAGNLPVYTVKPESKQGPSRTLHRDLLLSCSFLPVATADTPEPESIRRPKTRQTAATESRDEELNELDNEQYQLIQWVEDSPSEEVTRFTIVHEYPTPSKKPEMTNPPECDLPEPTANTEPITETNKYEDEFTGHLPVETTPDGDNTEMDNLVEHETVMIPDEPPEDSVEKQGHKLNGSPDKMDSSEPITTQPIRRSERVRKPSKRLEYSNLGNPLVTVVKSLFQGLSTAFSESLISKDEYWMHMQRDVHDM
ncbi:Retrovirus-related Pol polyprotein from transposon 412 [Labeo rohita]|uniref:Gypsy retrotransposon integrase-like protein 1 n=1 Tax=Labeo rohita TaxID=84645 RepID=A0A498M2P6_LABRO|nr:Retrovirus-related Pol polyprotein from transposon 412 [Labeo rohita]